jgi:hypothetical protein
MALFASYQHYDSAHRAMLGLLTSQSKITALSMVCRPVLMGVDIVS